MSDDTDRSLSEVVNKKPEEFQAEMLHHAQLAVAKGLTDVPPPKNVRELAAWYDIYRKMSGLDRPVTGLAIGILPASRSLQRRKIVQINLPPDPLADFEV